eukprot:TRINITY_DN14845_c0_g1_i3.p2 TRINITY_DN14845_c0_g1~~TRINITY_DN14845_c0_g1_i3.p2  ORF type:complete len:161 (+),score=27.19 TRINITY_DN14845_c0_g1_i3:1139-1621(+)
MFATDFRATECPWEKLSTEFGTEEYSFGKLQNRTSCEDSWKSLARDRAEYPLGKMRKARGVQQILVLAIAGGKTKQQSTLGKLCGRCFQTQSLSMTKSVPVKLVAVASNAITFHATISACEDLVAIASKRYHLQCRNQCVEKVDGSCFEHYHFHCCNQRL